MRYVCPARFSGGGASRWFSFSTCTTASTSRRVDIPQPGATQDGECCQTSRLNLVAKSVATATCLGSPLWSAWRRSCARLMPGSTGPTGGPLSPISEVAVIGRDEHDDHDHREENGKEDEQEQEADAPEREPNRSARRMSVHPDCRVRRQILDAANRNDVTRPHVPSDLDVIPFVQAALEAVAAHLRGDRRLPVHPIYSEIPNLQLATSVGLVTNL